MVIIKTKRDGYSVDQVAHKSVTVKEFIELLEGFDENDIILLSNDDGYTYGVITENNIEEI